MAEPVERSLHIVVVAHRGAAAREHAVAMRQRVAEQRGDAVLVVAHEPKVDGFEPRLAHECEQHRPIRVADLPRRERTAVNQLVAGREHAHPRAWVCTHGRHADARQHADMRAAHQRARGEHHLSGT